MSGGGRGGRSVKDHGDARRLPNINTIPGGASLHSNRNINGLSARYDVFCQILMFLVLKTMTFDV